MQKHAQTCLWKHDTQLRSCVKVEVAVLGFPFLIVLKVSVDVKEHWTGARHKGDNEE